MEIVYKKVSELKPYENNPRNNDNAVEYVANSIKEFGFKVPIVIDKDNVIVTGHTRLKASEKLGLKEVPCIIASDLTEEQIKAYRLADNKVSEVAEWNLNLLGEELDGILNIDMESFGFGDLEDIDIKLEQIEEQNPYTMKTDVPQYEIKGDLPKIEELLDYTKAKELEEEIKKSKIDESIKEFLISASKRHYVFDYGKIAEYYAHQNKEVQELMEKSALVIIDIDNAIANGYTQLRGEFDNLLEGDDEDDE